MISRRDLMKGVAAAVAFVGLKPEAKPKTKSEPFEDITVYQSDYCPIVINQESADRLRIPLQVMHEASNGDYRAIQMLEHAVNEAWNRGAL